MPSSIPAQRPTTAPLHGLRIQLIGAALLALVLLVAPAITRAAELLQVRSGTVLQVGDHNRNYTVELGCLRLPPGAEADAAAAGWLRQELPRRTRLNLRPLGSRDGLLVARVQRLAAGSTPELDLNAGLVAAGLAEALPECAA